MNTDLEVHRSIAWDLDGTLINGVNSRLFIDYINAHPHKEHHVITFRTPDSDKEFWLDELASLGVERSLIRSVQCVPNELYIAYATRGGFGGKAMYNEFFLFKGRAAKEIGATVLVDDMPSLVLPGCKAYGIAFIDAGKSLVARERL